MGVTKVANAGGQGKWKMLSLGLLLLLIVSVTFNVHSIFFAGSAGEIASTPMDFSFAWSNDSQRIVNDTFRLSLKMWLSGENLTMIITANDDEFGGDYVGLVFDTNQNRYIDTWDESYGLFSNNMTRPSFLCEDGRFAWAQVIGGPGPHNVTFDPHTGYTYVVHFPFYLGGIHWWNPAQVIRNGTYNQLQVCFFDQDAEEKGQNWVFTRFAFHTEEAQ